MSDITKNDCQGERMNIDAILNQIGRVNGWAPGNYMAKCLDCEIVFTGDKRARQCFPCAVKGQSDCIARLKEKLNEAEERNAMCVRYRVPAEPHPLFINIRAAGRWAVTRDGFVVNRHGIEEYEPQSSERDKDFSSRCYCDDLDEAFSRARAFLKENENAE
jgi:hypothetical protein